MLIQSFWALAAAASFSVMAGFVKLCNGAFSPLELVFYRSLFTLATIWVIVWVNGYSLKTPHWKDHLIRDVLGTVSVAIWFFTLGQLPLGTNITLTYTTPLFLAANFILLAFFRHQKAPWGAIGAILLGFAGIITILRPEFSAGQEIAALLCLTVAFIDLGNYWQIRKLGSLKEPSWRIVFYFALFCVIASFFGTIFLEDGFHMPTLQSGLCLLAMGLFATLGMITSTKAWVGGNMLLVACLGFSAIPFSEIISVVAFGHQTNTTTLVGMAIIIVAGMLSTRFTKKEEQQLKSEK